MGNADLSSAFGWVSIACWIVVYTPQIYENYTLKSGEGLSVFFVVIWLLGDLCNLVGAVMAGLLPTVIILGLYYSLCDVILLCQIYYYRWLQSMRPVHTIPRLVVSDEQGERAPLLRSKSIDDTRPSFLRLAIRYSLALGFVVCTGIIAWAISRTTDDDAGSGKEERFEWRSQVIGWISAVLYLSARVPQILKNFKTKCEGLSLALFMFSIAGNVTYVLSICAASMERKHLVANASWLAGSGLTVFLDVFVLCQFFYFRSIADMPLSEGGEGERLSD